MRWLAKLIYFKILGWKVVGNTSMSKETVKKAVLIAAPHTSNQDFFISLLLRQVLDIKCNFIAKKELFVWPLGYYFKAVGGAPLDRSSGQNKVQAIAALFQQKNEFRLAISPEGTRKKVDHWKTGFYFIAKAAKVPIIMYTLDFENKQNKISQPFYPTDHTEQDMDIIRAFFEGVKGKIPENS